MKKLLLTLLYMQSWAVLASDFPCMHLNIKIKNDTDSICYLTDSRVLSGNAMNSDLIRFIPPHETSHILSISEAAPASSIDYILTYQCGKNKTVQLLSRKGLCAINASVDGTVLAVENLDIHSEIYNGLYWNNKPGVIIWTIKDLLA